MRHLIIPTIHLITTVLRLVRPGGLRAVVAESVLARHQLLILNRSRQRAPNLRIWDRLIAGFCSLWIKSSIAGLAGIARFRLEPSAARKPGIDQQRLTRRRDNERRLPTSTSMK